MITGTFLAAVVGISWGTFLLYMAYGRDYAHEPLWVLVGVPSTVIAILLIGYFYYGMPIVDWSR
jgi:ABC-type nitrate/sulfonate/bicarbonate transport system permease component